MNLLEIFGTNVKKYRNAKHISQEELAEIAGLHRTYVSDIERFQRSISIKNIEKISTALEIEPYLLFKK